jgi:methylthioribose-1-phosphate isomerase
MSRDAARSYSPGVLPIKFEDGRILLVDQRKLPYQLDYFDATTHDQMCFAIKDMVVRGAPSIGVAAAYGLAAEMQRLAQAQASCLENSAAMQQILVQFRHAKNELHETRPTAVNLRWALEIIDDVVTTAFSDCLELAEIANLARAKADEIFEQHLDANFAISEFGAALVPKGSRIATHCNAGSLAACGYGTALGVIRAAHFGGKQIAVYVDETRPRNQGAKLTMWELQQDGVPSTLICDSMSGHLMAQGKIDMVITGADRIARNGDSANKIGTYNLAVLAHYHKIPFYIAAPLSTFDSELSDGKGIPIEEREHSEITCFEGRSATIDNATAFNPGFDVTPAELIAGIITEAGVLRPDYRASIARALNLELLAK